MKRDLITKIVADHHDMIISWHRRIHQYPELGLKWEQTAKLVSETLFKLGLDVNTGLAMTGISSTLHGMYPQPVVGLRVDMDGLLKGPCPDVLIGLHIDPSLESGHIGICFGPTMAGTVELELNKPDIANRC
ncbi:MAG: hypothetical protein K8S13_12340 [Desulfobacula sp.]|uniref:hypothetical protein n=1 Tax=Desulfobacula sp. TaxID=2593537 RepID=UPI0025BA2CFA|nr:hypothetical protein [Desulfobacula sp.]MCD4720626.1 hypothetical protein [Desulfobacula sp.]